MKGTIDQTDLRPAIKDFLDKLSVQPQSRRMCARCGAVMQYVECTFWLSGTDSAWNLKLPVCACDWETAAQPKPMSRNRNAA